jgi:hypothetical protein
MREKAIGTSLPAHFEKLAVAYAAVGHLHQYLT